MSRSINARTLRSKSSRKLDKALGELILEGVTSVPEVVEERLLELARHPDAEIGRQAVFLLGMRLRARRGFALLIDLASGSNVDSQVVLVAIRSLGAIGVEHADLRPRALAKLAEIALDSTRADDERGVAYLAARWATARATALELAQAPEDISLLFPDSTWLRSLVHGGERSVGNKS